SLRVIRLTKNSGGPSRPMNVGVEAAGSPIIALLDQDDLFAPRKLEHQTKLLQRHPDVPIVFGLRQAIDANGRWKGTVRSRARQVMAISRRHVGCGEYLLDRRALYREMVKGMNPVVGASNLCFWRTAWQRLGGFCEKMRIFWDCEFSAQACKLGDIAFVSRIIHFHRQHDANLSSRYGLYMREQATHLTQHLVSPQVDCDLEQVQANLADMYLGLGYW